MSCDHVQELLAERLDADLAPDAAAEVESHLAGCAECRGVDQRLVALMDDLALLARGPVPDGLADRIAANVPGPEGIRLASRRLVGLRVAACAAAMLLATLPLVSGGFSGRLADGVAPLVAEARQQVAKTRARGGLVAVLDRKAERGVERLMPSER